MITLNRILNYIIVFIFLLSGVITIASIFYSRIWWHVNVIMGTIFILIGLYYYAKANSIKCLILIVKQSIDIKKRNLSSLT